MPTSARKRIEDLVRISESTVWSGSPETTSQKMADALAEILYCELASIHLLDVTGDCFILNAVHRDYSFNIEVDAQESIRIYMTTGRMLQLMENHEPILMDFLHPDPADRIPSDVRGFRSAVCVPLLAGSDVLGMYTLVYKSHQHWTKQDIEYLLNIGCLLGIAVQHARFARKSTDLEILLERKRLSGELHDHLSQLVGTMNMGIEAAMLSWEEGNNENVQKDLERIKGVGQEAARVLREEMLSLRFPMSESEGLIRHIREYIIRFEQQWRIDTNLQVKDGLEPLFVSKQIELQFMRILHESLSNIIRHATASHVNVILQGDQDWLCMRIHDNGRGFEPDDVSNERLGLRIMRERADSLGGELSIESGNGSGTTIIVNVPRYSFIEMRTPEYEIR